MLLANLGTPDEPTPKAIRRYLREFLWDIRVVDAPRIIWWFVLQIILLIRPRIVSEGYKRVWTEQGSPLLVISKAQATKLQASLGDTATVELGMRYGNPSIASALDKLSAKGCTEITVLPAYPQYSASTSASVFDAVADWCKLQRRVPKLNFIDHYHQHPTFSQALAHSVVEYQLEHGKPDLLLMSFHGIPQRFVDLGDPYYQHCQETAEDLARNLGLHEDQWEMTFQSRVGREPWLVPYTDEFVKSLPAKGVKNVQVVCPGFSADCLETLDEVAVENREYFEEAGGEHFNYIPALNDRDDHIQAFAELVHSE